MTLEELEKLIADDDGEAVEVKEATGQRRDARNKRVSNCNFQIKISGFV